MEGDKGGARLVVVGDSLATPSDVPNEGVESAVQSLEQVGGGVVESESIVRSCLNDGIFLQNEVSIAIAEANQCGLTMEVNVPVSTVDLSSEGIAGERTKEVDGTGPPPSKVARMNKPPLRQKKIDPPVLLDSYDSRRDKALRKGKSLVKDVNEYFISTGSKAYFKSCFTYKNGTKLIYEAGKDFKLPGTKEVAPLTAEEMKASMEKTVTQTIVRTLKQTGTSKPNPRPTGSVISPRKTASVQNEDICHVCKKLDVVDGVLVFDSRMILCSKDGCTRCVHLDCLGFFVFEDAEIEKMPDWYCSSHRMEARRLHNVNHSYLQVASSSSPDVSVADISATSSSSAQQNESLPATELSIQTSRGGEKKKAGRGRGRGGRGRGGGRRVGVVRGNESVT